MATTPNLSLTLLVQGQLQQEVTVNGNLNILDNAVGGLVAAFGYDQTTSTGLTYGYYGGPILQGNTPAVVPAGTVTLTASATNYVQRSPAGSTVIVNTTGWVPGYIPMAEVVTNVTGITSVTDMRPSNTTEYGSLTINIGAPTGIAVTTAMTGGTIAASTDNEYQLTAVYPWGESAPSAIVSVTTGSGTSTNANTLTWTVPPQATSVNIYGRISGSIAKIANVAAGTTTYTDTGSVTPSGAAPANGNLALTEAEQNTMILSFEGALGAATTVNLASSPQVWAASNNTTNPYTLTLTAPNATTSGVQLGQGSSEVLFTDGTNVIAASSAGGGGSGGSSATLLKLPVTGGTVTLTPAQAANGIIELTGTLTSNLVLQFPSSLLGEWQVSNQTSGSYTTTALVEGSSAAAVQLAQGASQAVWSDGTNLTMTTGAQGPSGTISVGTVTTGAAGSSAAVSNSGSSTAAVFDFTIPQGVTGATGPTGPAGTITIGTVTTGAAGSSAAVSNSGTDTAAVLNFTIPQGATGNIGTAGSTIQQPILVGEVETQVTNTASGTAATLDQASGTVQVLTLTGDCTLTLSPSTGASGVTAAMTIILTQDSTGSRTVTWPTGTIFTAGSAPTLSTTAGQSDIFVAFLLAGSSNWVVAVIAQGVTL